MNRRMFRAPRKPGALFVLVFLFNSLSFGQEHDMGHMQGMQDMPGMEHMEHAHPTSEQVGEQADAHAMSMPGVFGDYDMSREASGTSWQPQSTPMTQPMLHFMSADPRGWMWMAHGDAYAIYDHAGGDRGGDKWISTNMFMLMGRKPLGDGVLGVRGMLSLEPATVGRSGYPELLQTGESADGQTPLIDRQHPHDLFMELSTSYSLPMRDGHDDAFIYLGLPGEPALGPATFMHRFSGMDNPEAPITHHWLDSTHVTFGVATIGYIINDKVKLEGSLFTGRESDQSRWDIETPTMDSQSVRVTYNPTDDWSMQVSYGHLNSPEALEPGVDVNRTTASVTYNHRLTEDGRSDWQTTFAYGRNDNNPGKVLDGFLLESAVVLDRTHTFFGRAEYVDKDELFQEGEPLFGKAFWVTKLSVGYIYDFPESHHVQFGIGALGSIDFLPDALDAAYGQTPTSYMIFGRVRW
jgi:hypothetical protein